MNEPNGSTAHKSLREWWLTPPRSGLQRVINPWEYRHLRLCGAARVAGAAVAVVPAAICLSYGIYGWAAFFFALGALNLAGGCWYLSIAVPAAARREPARTLARRTSRCAG